VTLEATGVGRHDRRTAPTPVSHLLIVTMATASGLAIASNYYVQALLPDMRSSLGLAAGTAALLISAAQLGYGVGLALILPLGDLLERRRLVTALMLAVAVGLATIGAAQSVALAFAAVVFVGMVTVVAQVLTVFAASLVREEVRGRVVGAVMSGFSAGVLLARTASGLLAEAIGWRGVYVLACAVMAAATLALRASLPVSRPVLTLGYRLLLTSTAAMFGREPVLRRRAVYCSSSFAAFSTLWAAVALLLSGPPYHYSTGRIGTVGLIGVVGLVASPLVGWLSDRRASHVATRAGALLITTAWLPLWRGGHSFGWLVVGIALIVAGHQCLMVTSFGEIYRLPPELRSRLNAALMVTYFVAGAGASTAVAGLWPAFGWSGVCVAGATCAAVSVALSVTERRDVPVT
jgi:predicted MFS family arabinose efflux permease